MRRAHFLSLVVALALNSCTSAAVDVRGLAATHATAVDVEAIHLLVQNPPEGIQKNEWGSLKSLHFIHADEARLSLDGDDLDVRVTVRKKKGRWTVDKKLDLLSGLANRLRPRLNFVVQHLPSLKEALIEIHYRINMQSP
jgi:hypothetical protein